MYDEWLALPETKAQIVKAFAKDVLNSQIKAQIPPKFRDFTIAALTKNPGLLAIIEKYIDNFQTDGSRGLYLWGNIGAGKTTTAAIVGNELIGRYWTDCLMINWAT
jgi:DNA replication protein DnaC